MFKNKVSIYLVVFVFVAIFMGIYATGSNKNNRTADNKPLFGAAAAEIDKDLTLNSMLKYAMEQEVYAEAQYKMIFEQYGTEGQQPFFNILEHQREHLKVLEALVSKYNMNIEMPKGMPSDYVIHPDSLEESFNESVQLQSNTIFMYDKFLRQELPEDIKKIFVDFKKDAVGDLESFDR